MFDDDVMLVYKDQRKLDTINYGRFWNFLTQNYLRRILGTNKQKNPKELKALITVFTVNISILLLLLLIFHLLVSEIEICLKQFLNKNLQKRPL